MPTPYDTDLDRNAANFQPLTPLSFLARAAEVYPDQTAIIHGARSWNYRQFYARARQLASALARRGIKRGDTVSVMLANTPAMIEAHYGVPMAGAVLNTLNTRLDAAILAFTLDHAETKVLIVDREFSKVMKDALARAKAKPLVIDYDDPEFTGAGERLGSLEYEEFLREGDADFAWLMPDDEWDAISLNYTSGTTGDPKGVVYHHRGAYLLALGNVLTCGMAKHPVYLWTLPMFHCNGWCFPVDAVDRRRHPCLPARGARGADLRRHRHPQGDASVRRADRDVDAAQRAARRRRSRCRMWSQFATAAAPPPEAVLAAMKAAGFNVTHLYGLTETYGPASINDWHREWDALSVRRAGGEEGAPGRALSGAGRRSTCSTRKPCSRCRATAQTLGEVMFRGNVVMKGYLKNKPSTEAAFAGGWFHSGDLGVVHPDGYIQLKDRSKDIIISGGENISSIEVEDALYKHPAVAAVAVVAKPDEKWGETPCAFVELKPGAERHRRRTDRLVPLAPRRLQMPALRGVRRHPENQHREDSEIQAARRGQVTRCDLDVLSRW